MVVPFGTGLQLVTQSALSYMMPMKVLFLSAWYPTPRDAMAGLFVHKHAQALREQGVDVRVLYNEEKGWDWWKTMYRDWRALRDNGWKPDVVQVNVLDKNGIVAWLLWWLKDIPYVIVEHWSGYLAENGQFMQQPGWKKLLMRFVSRHARMILPVSERLQAAMQACGIENKRWERIDNVVDDRFYEIATVRKADQPKRLLHVSCFDEASKNVKGLLRATRALLEQRKDVTMSLIGTGRDWDDVRQYADTLDFPQGVLEWKGEQTPEQVCKAMHEHDALVLFSNYETYGIVLAEAMAAGLPSISTKSCGLEVPEACGIRVEAGDEQQLTKAMKKRVEHPWPLTREKMQSYASAFRAETIGARLKQLYEQVIKG